MPSLLKRVVVGVGALLLVFMFLPTGNSANEVLDGFQSTQSISASTSAYLAYLSQFQDAWLNDTSPEFAGSKGEQIADFAVWLCDTYGNGGGATRKAGQFRYTKDTARDYWPITTYMENLNKLRSSRETTCGISCCAFATGCWEILLLGKPPYGTSCTSAVLDNFYGNDIIRGDGTAQYIKDNAMPGDLVFYTEIQSTEPPVPVRFKETYCHVEVYIGPRTGKDAGGAAYEYEHAMAGSNSSKNKRDAYIKELDNTLYRVDDNKVKVPRYPYLVPLTEWARLNPEAVDNSEQVESLEDILNG